MSKAIELIKNCRTAFAEGKTIVELMTIIDQAAPELEKQPKVSEQEKMDMATIGSLLDENKKLQAENEQLRKILAEEIDDGRAEVDEIGVDAWIEQALIAKGGGQAEGEGEPSTTNNTNPQPGTESGG